MRVVLCILGEPASKANSRELVMFGKGAAARPAIIKSKKAREYEKEAVKQIPSEVCVMFRGPVRVTMTVYYASERPDLDESVILDVLQAKYEKAKKDGHGHSNRGPRALERPGVYVNDRQVREKHVFHRIDAGRPRAEIVVEALAPQQQGLELPQPELELAGIEEDPF